MQSRKVMMKHLRRPSHAEKESTITKRLGERLNAYSQTIGDWLYKKDQTWRRFVHDIRLWGLVGILFTITVFLFALWIYRSAVLSYLLPIAKEEIGDLFTLGNRLGLIGQDFATVVTAEVIADFVTAVAAVIVAGILGLLFLGKVTRGVKLPTADIRIMRQREPL